MRWLSAAVAWVVGAAAVAAEEPPYRLYAAEDFPVEVLRERMEPL